MVWPAIRSKAVLLLLLIHCLLLLSLSVGPCFVIQYLVSLPVLQSARCGRERAGCFALIVFLVSCDCKYFVALKIPHGPMGWVGLLCDCGIS